MNLYITKISKANKLSHKIIEANVRLGVEKYRHTAEINLRIDGITLSAKEETEDMYASFDRSLEKIQRQLSRYRDRYKNKVHNAAKAARKNSDSSAADGSAWEEDEDDFSEPATA